MGRVKYAVTVVMFFGLIGALYVYDRLQGQKIRRRLVTYRDWEDADDET
jgi:hypothetical protein